MARNNNLISLRNKNVKMRYRQLEIKYPRWKHGAIIDELIKEFYVSERTLSGILNSEGSYNTAV